MMTLILFRIIMIIALILLVYTFVKYYNSPQRKLAKAKIHQEFYLLDDPNHIKQNLKFVYKGCSFEGEKHMGLSDDGFKVITIQITVKDKLDLQALMKEDLFFLEEKLLIRYPHASIQWMHPINQLLGPTTRSNQI